MIRSFPGRLGVSLAVLTCLGSSAHALERVTLTSGLTYDCARHEQLGNNMRLYTSKDDTNYQDIVAARVVSIEMVPDLPEPVVAAVEAKPVEGSNAKPTTEELHAFLASAGAAHDIDVDLLASLVKTESNFRVDAVSRAGARGLMQLMPGTAREQGVQDVTRADQNIAGGTAYLDSLLKLYKDDVRLALAAYNAGPAAVARYHNQVPPYRETQAYVNRVIKEFNRRVKERATTVVASR